VERHGGATGGSWDRIAATAAACRSNRVEGACFV
jgi:hypothetical protein